MRRRANEANRGGGNVHIQLTDPPCHAGCYTLSAVRYQLQLLNGQTSSALHREVAPRHGRARRCYRYFVVAADTAATLLNNHVQTRTCIPWIHRMTRQSLHSRCSRLQLDCLIFRRHLKCFFSLSKQMAVTKPKHFLNAVG